MGSVKEMVDSSIANNKVMVFSKSYCPFCQRAISALQNLGIKALEVKQIENEPNMNEIQDYLSSLTGGRSVPRVFVGGKFVGGCDETMTAISNGSLQKMLTDAGAI